MKDGFAVVFVIDIIVVVVSGHVETFFGIAIWKRPRGRGGRGVFSIHPVEEDRGNDNAD